MFTSYASFLLILFFSFPLFSAGAANTYIGALVNTDFRNGREQKVAIEIAAQYFNSSSSPLYISVSDLSSNDSLEISTHAKDLINWGAEVIIGTGTWPEVATLTKFANTTRIPVLSLATTTPTFSSLMPSLVQMSHPISSEVDCLADIIRSYNWRRVIVIYEDDLYGGIPEALPFLSNALQAHGSQIDHYIAFPPLHIVSNVRERIHQTLKTIPPQLSKVFVVLRSSPELTIPLFEEAKELGMMEKDHVWIVNDDITTLLDSTLSPSFVSSYMQGVIGITTYFNTTSNSYRKFSSLFRQRFKQEYETKGEHHFEPGMYAVRAYDAVNAIVHAIAAKAESKSITWLEGILTSNFSGLSGIIKFTRDGSLLAGRGYSAFRVLNVVGKSYVELGFWLEGFGFFENEVEMGCREPVVDVLHPVFWPGRTEKIPGGWGRLKIGVPNHTTFDQFVKVEYDNSTGKVEVTGFCIDVFNMILGHLKYDLLYDFIPFNGSYDDLVNQVPSKKIDAVVGDITILAERSINATFTEPFLSSGLSMLVPVIPHTPWMLTKPFTKEVWFLILAALIYIAGVVWYLEHEENPEFSGTWWVQLGATVWLILSTIFFAHGRIYSYYTKIVVMIWLIVVLILMSSFTANLSSILIVEKLKPVPPGSRVGCDGASFVLKYLQDVLDYKDHNIERIETPEAYNDAFKSNNISAAYLETPYLKVFLSTYDDFTVSGETYRLGGLGFVFPKDSPLAADFSEVILKLEENGSLKNLEKKWFSFVLCNSPAPNNERIRDSLSLDNFWVLFLFMGCTSTMVLLLFSTRSKLLNGIERSTVSFEPLGRSFKKFWTGIAKFRSRGVIEPRRVSPISFDPQGSTMKMGHVVNENPIELHRPAGCTDIDGNQRQIGNSVLV